MDGQIHKILSHEIILPRIINTTDLITAGSETTRTNVYIEIFQMEE